jgi:hypothetical protein
MGMFNPLEIIGNWYQYMWTIFDMNELSGFGKYGGTYGGNTLDNY